MADAVKRRRGMETQWVSVVDESGTVHMEMRWHKARKSGKKATKRSKVAERAA